MTQDDVLFGYRLQLFDLAAARRSAQACRLIGVHRSTYYRWKRQVDRTGLGDAEAAGAAAAADAQPALADGRAADRRVRARAPGFGPRRIARELARPKWGGIIVSPNGVWRLCRHGLNTRAKRLSLVAGYRAPYEPPREPAPERHIERRPGELVGIDCFFVGRLHGTKGPVWQLTAIDASSYYAWADLVVCPRRADREQTSKLARRVARELRAAGWRLERVLTDNGTEFGRHAFGARLPAGVAHTRIRAGRPQTNGHVERLHRTILEECWRPAFARYLHLRFPGLRRELNAYIHDYNNDRVHHGRLTHGRSPADIVYGASKMKPR